VLLQNSFRQHAVINAPVDSNSVSLARVLSDGSFPHVLAGSASTLDGFGTCSMFIRITACLLADPLSGLCTKGFEHFIASMLASAATGWSVSCRVGLLLSHWSSAPFHGARRVEEWRGGV
jgi:hypothetical protein